MAIFMLSPKEKKKDEGSAKVEEGAKGIPQEALIEAGKEQTTPSSQEPTALVPNEGVMPLKEIDERTITIDGPLGQVFTEALNQAFAKESSSYEVKQVPSLESYITDLRAYKNTQDAENPELIGGIGDYVYVVHGHFLEAGGLVEAFESISTATRNLKNVSLVFEHEMNVSSKAVDLIDFARSMNATVYSTRKAAVEAFVNKLKSA